LSKLNSIVSAISRVILAFPNTTGTGPVVKSRLYTLQMVLRQLPKISQVRRLPESQKASQFLD
jgi:hypothetical protein